ncbi:MAG: peptidylprolyl isomerase [archaeon]|nr:peptidylprolyl isomerase [archaeon]
MKFLIALLLVSLVLFGCVQSTTNTSTGLIGIKETGNTNTGVGQMSKANIVENGDTIQVDYTGTLVTGEQFDSSVGREPLEFTVGSGQLIVGFDEAVIGMKLNEEKTSSMSPEKAYGLRNEELVQQVPLSDLNAAGITPEVGMTLYAGGRAVTIVGINDQNAVVDFNHELAGKTLTFKIKVLKITKANASVATTTQ